ncbi:hypothetical protein LXL04_033487 [Taraxacum kok-saghyz]
MIEFASSGATSELAKLKKMRPVYFANQLGNRVGIHMTEKQETYQIRGWARFASTWIWIWNWWESAVPELELVQPVPVPNPKIWDLVRPVPVKMSYGIWQRRRNLHYAASSSVLHSSIAIGLHLHRTHPHSTFPLQSPSKIERICFSFTSSPSNASASLLHFISIERICFTSSVFDRQSASISCTAAPQRQKRPVPVPTSSDQVQFQFQKFKIWSDQFQF